MAVGSQDAGLELRVRVMGARSWLGFCCSVSVQGGRTEGEKARLPAVSLQQQQVQAPVLSDLHLRVLLVSPLPGCLWAAPSAPFQSCRQRALLPLSHKSPFVASVNETGCSVGYLSPWQNWELLGTWLILSVVGMAFLHHLGLGSFSVLHHLSLSLSLSHTVPHDFTHGL